jgi:hypothetical protein
MDVERLVIAVFEKVCEKKGLKPETEFFEVIPDSFAFAQVAGELDPHFPGIFDDMLDAKTIQDVIDIARKRMPA